ncbi:hypothetical protein Q5741_02915 [Paenibacillus sp. JX-17]|uniref:Uncharacterized protein n=1 Tax=Paenibacillus lacisoli TaxID=3064525 RepID=A0ABT9C7W7_9BACL|nr:hypothetical protein [Paenibacillus sp. JX-17]MDO7905362.1 hypothetical protein [Paenibacillus sp. JX-17]
MKGIPISSTLAILFWMLLAITFYFILGKWIIQLLYRYVLRREITPNGIILFVLIFLSLVTIAQELLYGKFPVFSILLFIIFCCLLVKELSRRKRS